MTRSHGFLVYDTLFGLDDDYQVRPQMVDRWSVSDDGLVYEFTLRPDLRWHDGDPVTSEDCVASIRRWGARDGLGRKLMEHAASLKPVDARTFRLTLSRPWGMVLPSLAKITSNVPFMMKKEQALTDPFQEISEVIGSGPFRFVPEAFEPGVRAAYVKNPDYRPRPEPAQNTAGGKIPGVDRVEIVWKPRRHGRGRGAHVRRDRLPAGPGPGTTGHAPQHPGRGGGDLRRPGSQPLIRLNHLQPPFDNVKARRAVLWATDVPAALKAALGEDASLYEACPSMFTCDTPLSSDAGAEPLMGRDLDRARRLLREAGYAGEPVVILQPTDDRILNVLSDVTAENLRGAGFTVELQAMSWATLAARRDSRKPAAQGGWNLFLSWFNGPEFINPAEHVPLDAGCDAAWFGWPCDGEIRRLRAAFADASDPARQRDLAVAPAETGVRDRGVRAPGAPFFSPWRTGRTGWRGWCTAPCRCSGNVTKK